MMHVFCTLLTRRVLIVFAALTVVCSTASSQCVSWDYVGAPDVSGTSASESSIAVNSSGVPFVFYDDLSVHGKPVVKKFNGTSWEVVGATATVSQDSLIMRCSLVIAPDGQPMVAYFSHATGLKIKKFDGTNWANISGMEGYPLAVKMGKDGNFYAMVYSFFYDTYVLYKYNWSTVSLVGGPIFATVPEPNTGFNETEYDFTVTSSGIPYVAYNGGVAPGDLWYDTPRPYVATYNGSAWVTSSSSYMATFSSEQGAVIETGSDGNQHFLFQMYNGQYYGWLGSGGVWSGPQYVSPNYFTNIKLRIGTSNEEYVFANDYMHDMRGAVLTKSGWGAWSYVGPSVFTAPSAQGLCIAISGSNEIFVSYVDGSNGNKVVVKKKVTTFPSITGQLSICSGEVVTLGNATEGGTWTSGNSAVATIGSTSGVVTGINSGTSVISYVAGSCVATAVVTMNTVAGIITGSSSVCVGSTATLGDTATGGIWSSNNPSFVAVGSTTGIVSGVSRGTATISYTKSGCFVTKTLTAEVTTVPLISGLAIAPSSILSTFAGTGTAGFSGDGGQASSAKVNVIFGILKDRAGNVYISERINRRVRKIDTNGIITTFAGSGSGVFSGDGGPATAAGFNSPHELAEDSHGNIYIADEQGYRVRKVSTAGIITTVAGTGAATYGGDGGAATAAKLNRPAGVVVDAADNIYIAESYSHRIRKIDASGIITTFAGTGTAGYNGDDIAATAAMLNYPTYLYIDTVGNVFISDMNNNRVRKISVHSGKITTVAGTGSVSPEGDGGMATAAGLSQPHGITMDRFGNMYIADRSHHRVRKVNSSGIITTVAGTGVAGFTADESTSTGSKLNSPTDVAIDRNGNLLVMDYGNYRVRIVRSEDRVSMGVLPLCVGANTTLDMSVPGGAWVSSNSSIASVGTNGVVTGIANGTAFITYTTTNSCSTEMAIVTVNVGTPASAGTISGPSNVCSGTAIMLTASVGGGTWSSSNAAVATAGTDGTISGVALGTAVISYTVMADCGPSLATHTVTVNSTAAAGAISGSLSVCAGSATALTNSVLGGSWTSSNTAVATVGTSGIVMGASAGTSDITYIVVNSCGTATATATVTVNALPDAGTLAGTANICVGSTTTITTTGGGGSWSSSNAAVATIDTGGVVTALATGTSNISYTVSGACGTVVATTVVTVNAPADAGSITGSTSVCVGTSTTLSTTGMPGSWSSGNASVATIGSAGLVSGVAPGTSVISYVVTNVCGADTATVTVTVGALADAGTISGATSLCAGGSVSLSSTGSGGTWSSGNTSVATIGSSTGVVIGVASGTAGITYSVSNGCGAAAVSTTVTVDLLFPDISGATGLCIGGTISLTHPVSGGTWGSSDPGVATIDGSGLATGISNGTTTITYSATGGCMRTLTVTVGLPSITGTTNVCIGSTTALSNAVTGGVWSTAVPYYATVDASTGVVTGVNQGTTMVTYSTGGGCYVTAMIYVPNISLNITGVLSMCPGNTSSLSVPGYPGGSWSSSNGSVATIHPTFGTLAGVSTGTATITYTYAYCLKTAVATINAVPAAITGGSAVCTGSTLSLSCATGGGVWSSSSPSRATVNSSGVVTGVSAGVTTIVYTVGGCSSTLVVTVGAVPASITGTTTVCAGSITTLSCSTGSGTWSSSAPGVAAIVSSTGTSAMLSGASTGVSTITFRHSGGCEQTVAVSVTATPGAIGGVLSICTGGTSALSASPGGGTWSSSDYSKVSVNATTGVITGVSAGTGTITYRSGAACYTTAAATVDVAAGISGGSTVCIGLTTALSHGTGGGTWGSSSVGVATVDASGVVTGVSAGVANITYHIGTGCYAVKSITVYSNPPAISGASSLCAGSSTTLSNTSGGASVWVSSDVSVATIGSTGVVTGVSAGVTEVTYTKTATGCYVTKLVTVNETPATIAGSSTICVGADELYTSSPSGGTWTSSVPSVGTVNATTGVVTGRTGGGTIIRYTLPTGCQVSKAVTVMALPGVITGAGVVCIGNSITLSSTTGGGTWSTVSSSVSLAGTASATVIVTGSSTGTAEISYMNASGCMRSYTVTVNAALAPITGEDIVCVGGAVTLTDATPGGSWSSSATGKVGIGTYTGIATGGSTVGSATITYRVGAGCFTTKTMTNNAALPNISGATFTCSGVDGAVTFSNSVSGGTWSSSNTSVATVDAASGVVTGMLLGGTNTYVNIIYATSAGCMKTKSILIKPQPLISGAGDVAVGGTTTLAGSPTGGVWSSSSSGVAAISGYGVVTGLTAGIATITYTAAGCENTHDVAVTGSVLSRPVGMNEGRGVQFSVFPNPTHGSISVSTEVGGALSVYTVDGRQVSVNELVAGTNVIVLPGGLVAGVYTARFVGVDGSVRAVRLVYEP